MIARRTRRLHRWQRTQRLAGAYLAQQQARPACQSAAEPPTATPPEPPLKLTPAIACDPHTAGEVLWYIARHVPELRRWLVANPRADASLLEYVSQAGGPGVREALELLLESMEVSS